GVELLSALVDQDEDGGRTLRERQARGLTGGRVEAAVCTKRNVPARAARGAARAARDAARPAAGVPSGPPARVASRRACRPRRPGPTGPAASSRATGASGCARRATGAGVTADG